MPTGILEVKLGRPYEMPDRRLRLLLERARRDCCVARNAAVTHWLLWRRSHPEWRPGGEYQAPARKITRAAKPQPNAPKDPPYAPREFLSRELYGVASVAAPGLSASVCSSCVQEVNARLRANTPYNHDGEARFVWQAILTGEVSLPTWRGGRIPMPRSMFRLRYTESECALRFPLLSKKSGYRVLSPLVRLHASDLSRENRRVLQRMAAGELRVADSQLTERKGHWFAQLCYDVPVRAVDLPVDRVLTVGPSLPGGRRPFWCQWPAEDDPARLVTWGIGNGIPLVADYRRVVARRRALRDRYSDGCGSGHGRQRWYKTIKPLSRYIIDLQARFTKQAVADIVALAIRERCGAVLYREPTMPVRDNCWFAGQDVPFDWTSFGARLAHRCAVSGLEHEVTRIGMAEWRPRKQSG